MTDEELKAKYKEVEKDINSSYQTAERRVKDFELMLATHKPTGKTAFLNLKTAALYAAMLSFHDLLQYTSKPDLRSTPKPSTQFLIENLAFMEYCEKKGLNPFEQQAKQRQNA